MIYDLFYYRHVLEARSFQIAEASMHLSYKNNNFLSGDCTLGRDESHCWKVREGAGGREREAGDMNRTYQAWTETNKRGEQCAILRQISDGYLYYLI